MAARIANFHCSCLHYTTLVEYLFQFFVYSKMDWTTTYNGQITNIRSDALPIHSDELPICSDEIEILLDEIEIHSIE